MAAYYLLRAIPEACHRSRSIHEARVNEILKENVSLMNNFELDVVCQVERHHLKTK